MVSKNPADKRNYRHEYDEYQGKPEQIKHRDERNAARAAAEKAAGGKKLSGDVAHKVPLARGGRNTSANERVESVAKNRSWRRGQRGYHVPDDE
jgi:hypothetical protein